MGVLACPTVGSIFATGQASGELLITLCALAYRLARLVSLNERLEITTITFGILARLVEVLISECSLSDFGCSFPDLAADS